MKVRFSPHPEVPGDPRPAWAGEDERTLWVVPNVVRLVFDGVRKRPGERVVVGLHPGEEAYVPVLWSRETVVLTDASEGVEAEIRPI